MRTRAHSSGKGSPQQVPHSHGLPREPRALSRGPCTQREGSALDLPERLFGQPLGSPPCLFPDSEAGLRSSFLRGTWHLKEKALCTVQLLF